MKSSPYARWATPANSPTQTKSLKTTVTPSQAKSIDEYVLRFAQPFHFEAAEDAGSIPEAVLAEHWWREACRGR
jgi:hypothetical protein